MKYGSSHWRARKELGEPRACLASMLNVVGVVAGAKKSENFLVGGFFVCTWLTRQCAVGLVVCTWLANMVQLSR